MDSNNQKHIIVQSNEKIRGYRMEHISIIDSKNHVDKEVQIKGWVANKRSRDRKSVV